MLLQQYLRLFRVREAGHLLPRHQCRRSVGGLGPDERRRSVAHGRDHAARRVHLLHGPVDIRVVREVDARPVAAGEEHRGVRGRVDVRQLRGGRHLGLGGRVRVETTRVVRQEVFGLEGRVMNEFPVCFVEVDAVCARGGRWLWSGCVLWYVVSSSICFSPECYFLDLGEEMRGIPWSSTYMSTYTKPAPVWSRIEHKKASV